MADDSDPTIPDLLDLDEPEDEAPDAAPSRVEPPPWAAEGPMYVDVDGNVHVAGGRFFSSRIVGSVQGMEAEAVIGGLVERFQELEDRFANLEREVRASRNRARALKSVRSFARWVEGADAVGDFPGLLERVHALADELESAVTGSRTTRLQLVERAEALATSTDWRSTGQAMEELMEAWKKAGSAGGRADEELWQRFRAARKTFFDRRSRHSSELRRARAAARSAKEALIARAEELAPSRDWGPTSAAMDELMEAWKQAGSAGRKRDDELWQRFRAARDPFFAARREHFARERRASSRQRPHREGDRRGQRGERPPGRPGQRRSGGSAPLRASLAEIVGPLRDLYPSSRSKEPDSAGPPRRPKKTRKSS